MENEKLLIIGCGGHSKVVTEIAEAIGIKNIQYLDQLETINNFLGKKPFTKINENFIGNFVVAIGDNSLREKVLNILDVMIEKRFIFNVGHGLTPDCKINNVKEVINIVRGYNRKIS